MEADTQRQICCCDSDSVVCFLVDEHYNSSRVQSANRRDVTVLRRFLIPMTYEGWENYDTWNVALWINNEKPYYDLAVAFMKKQGAKPNLYMQFVSYAQLANRKTPDNVSFIDASLNIAELNQMMLTFLEK